MALGLYVHFPFCRSVCPYCDFAVFVSRAPPHRAYADAVLAELELRAEAFADLGPLRSVFFGGGTPSLWDPREVGRLLAAVQARFGPAREVTLEMNPDDLDPPALAALRGVGVTRASIGVQSFDAGVLKALGRRHSGQRAAAAIAEARAAGFLQVSVDLIFGGPGQTLEGAAADAARAVASAADHVSAYGLTLDELAVEVPLARSVRQGRVAVADADQQAALGAAVAEVLEAGGLRRYEISNFARPGCESLHNLGYWNGDPYLGLGVGAYGATPALRYGNPRELAAYLEPLGRGALPAGERDPLDAATRLRERVFLGLRRVAGLDLASLAEEFGTAAADGLRLRAAPFVARGLATLGDRLALTPAGLDLHSELAARLI